MIVNLLADMSLWTWKFLSDAPFRPREETITESLLVDLGRRGRGQVWVHKATTGVESRTGLDWAWALKTTAGWVIMVVQAKQADGLRFAKYPELRKRDATDQVDDLLYTAAMVGALPVYVFYQGEVHPFGAAGETTWFGACPRKEITRGPGLPWTRTASALGITVAHAEDVMTYIVPPPAANQRAETVNNYAMPLECLLCPGLGLRHVTADAPRILEVAAQIAHLSTATQVESPWLVADSRPSWIQPEQPSWVGDIIEGIGPREDREDVPDASYYLVTDLTGGEG
ncbi:DUF6615 family protein [Kribbella sp. NPDC058245]|uniref:DUF6615 family protein n=1 Tax=Kribbella sp. NPDC058245 TaxID=3346399 RepID=UPI0036EFAA4A